MDTPELRKIVHTKLPFICADFLGLTNIIEEKPLNQVVDYLDAFNYVMVETNVYCASNITCLPKIQFISDSALVFIDNATKSIDFENYVKHMVKFLSVVLHKTIYDLNHRKACKRIPLRAALAFDEYIGMSQSRVFKTFSKINYSPDDRIDFYVPIITGKAVVESYDWERRQNWLGASFCPKAYRCMNDEHSKLLEELKSLKLIIEYDVPIKDNDVTSRQQKTYAINFNFEGYYEFLRYNLEKLEKQYAAVGKDISGKYKAAKIFLDFCNGRGFVISKQLLNNGDKGIMTTSRQP